MFIEVDAIVLIYFLLAALVLVVGVLAFLCQRLRSQVQGQSDRLAAAHSALEATQAELAATRQASEAAKTQLDATLKAIPDLLMEMDLEGRYLAIGTARRASLYRPSAELLGQRMVDVLPASVVRVMQAALQEAQELGHSAGRSYAMELAAGTKWFELSVARKDTPVGEVPRFIVIARDISARKQAQQQTQQALLEQRAMLENDLVGIVKTSDRKVVWSNQAFSNMSGYTSFELLGASARKHFSDEAAFEQFGEKAYKVMNAGKVYRTQLELRRKNGASFWVDVSGALLTAEAGRYLWVFLDITDRKLAEQRLRQLSLTVQHAPMAIVVTQLDGEIEYVNPWFTKVTGYSLDEVVGKNPRILNSGLTPPAVFKDLWLTLLSGGVWHGELHNHKKNGDLFVEYAVIAPVLDDQGQATHYVGLKEDITQRKHQEEVLQNSLRDKVALLHEVHHRVKNNLQVVTSLLRLEAGRSAQAGTQAVLKEMQGRIHTMALLHENLYRTGTFAMVDLGDYVRQLALQAFRAQGEPNGQVRLRLDLAPVNVGMDQATPCGLLVNELLTNCLKHAFLADQSGEVVVCLQPSADTGLWRLSVQDNGVGLPVDFELKRTHSLGLQLVADLALQLGGTLAVSSDTGACFTVLFPIQVFPVHD